MIIYLAGTVDRVEPAETLRRFAKAQNQLEDLGVTVLNPLRGKHVSSTQDDFLPYEPNEIVHRDEQDVDTADIIVAQMLIPSIGTSMEIYRARQQHKPVIVVSDNPAITEHYWIRVKATKVVGTLDEAVEYLREWYLQ